MKKHQEYCEIVNSGRGEKVIISQRGTCLQYENGDIRYFSSFGAEKYLKKNGWTKSEKTDLTGLTSNWRPQSTWIKQQKYCDIVEVRESTVIVKLATNKYLQDENEEIRHFPDFLDAANYLSKNGWYLSQIYSNVYGSSSHGTSVGSSAHWIMAKEVED